jgi:hypothetical protein
MPALRASGLQYAAACEQGQRRWLMAPPLLAPPPPQRQLPFSGQQAVLLLELPPFWQQSQALYPAHLHPILLYHVVCIAKSFVETS